MGTRTTRRGTASTLAELDAVPSTSDPRALLVKNVSQSIHVIRSHAQTLDDTVLQLHTETVLPAEWSRNRSLRSLIKNGQVTFEWVGEMFEPKEVPTIDMAPDEIQPGGESGGAGAAAVTITAASSKKIANMQRRGRASIAPFPVCCTTSISAACSMRPS